MAQLSNKQLCDRAYDLGAKMFKTGFDATDNPYTGASRMSLAKAWMSGYNVARLVKSMEDHADASSSSK